MGFINRIFGSYSSKELARIEPIKNKVLALDEEYQQLSDAELKAKTQEFKDRLEIGETLDTILRKLSQQSEKRLTEFSEKSLIPFR